MRLKDRVAVVTGGGCGIGRAISLAFAREGAIIVVASPFPEELDEVVGKIKDGGGRALAVVTDVTLEDQVVNMVSRTVSEFRKIDILVNNAGIAGPTALLVDMPLDAWNQTLAINLTGMMLCTREALKVMISRESGNIINLSSQAGRAGYGLRSPYCASKWGVIGLTMTTATEVGVHHIRANCICPGPVEGPRMDAVFRARAQATGRTSQELYDETAAGMALRKLVTADDIAAAAVFLASDESKGITGEALDVNAGSLLNVL